MNPKLAGGLIVLAVVGGVMQCSGGSTTTTTPAPSVSTPAAVSADASAQLACGHFRNVMSDISSGLLTPGEVRTKTKEVYDTAYVSESAGIADSARSMLAAATADNGPAFVSAAADLMGACEAAGV